jgi:UDP-N-acetylglucosamine 4,6-dehydratase
MSVRNFRNPWPNLENSTILVTGGTGTFGTAFVEFALRNFKLKKLIVFSRDEFKQHQMAERYSAADHEVLRFFLGDVRDQDRLEMAMRGVDYVVHAAALKQVTAAEYNPFECIRTNVNGAENIVRAALRNQVKCVIALSTDKACNPANLYGASKLASDKIFVAANALSGSSGTAFSLVRYGNVVGSRGSVIPVFLDLIRKGREVLPITDPRMTRFWITVDQGVSFLVSCLGIMQGGEIFVPKIPSVLLPDLVAAISPDIKTETVGIRPGEKIHEAMISVDDARSTVELEDRYIITPPRLTCPAFRIEKVNGKSLPEDFTYTSDTNPERLNTDQVRVLLKQSGWLAD